MKNTGFYLRKEGGRKGRKMSKLSLLLGGGHDALLPGEAIFWSLGDGADSGQDETEKDGGRRGQV